MIQPQATTRDSLSLSFLKENSLSWGGRSLGGPRRSRWQRAWASTGHRHNLFCECVCVCICARGERRNGRKPLRIRIHPNKRNTDQLDSSSHALRLRHCSKATAAVIISKESHFEEEKRKKILFFFFLL